MNIYDNIKQLLDLITPICKESKRIEEQRRLQGEYFNVFSVMGVESYEVRLHSAFLAELLNPCGSHGLRATFLQEFLKLLSLPADYIDFQHVDSRIVERYIGEKTETTGGRIDIIIEDGHHAIIIENKIYAQDQENQLLRYNNYAKEHFPNGYELIYLTLEGAFPSNYSLSNESINYKCLSYSSDILQWLETCLKDSESIPPISEIIKQYISTLKYLTNQYMDNEYLKNIADVAVENIDATLAILDAKPEIFNLLLTRYIFEPLKEWAKEKELEILIDLEGQNIFFKKSLWKSGAAIEVTSDKYTWKDMYIGITYNKECDLQNKLDCLKKNPNTWWPYGWEYLPDSHWESTSSYPNIKEGKVFEWIKNKIEEIIDEIEMKSITL